MAKPVSKEDNFEIPIIDFSAFSLEIDEGNAKESDVTKLADEICRAFKTVGFVYLKNYGISSEKIEEIQSLARRFFSLPAEVKQKYAQQGIENNHGWVALGREEVNPERPGDLKEVYDVRPSIAKTWPDEDLPDFKPLMLDAYKVCTELANRVLYLIALGLKLKNPNFFRERHNPWRECSIITARVLYYPAPGADVKPNQIALGEHTDYGSITLLFQDDVGGLQVMNRNGEYVPATPIPDTVVVNVADLMQRWTADELVSTRHRVILPKQETGRPRDRISFVLFDRPDGDCMIECVDGSNKYEPITALDYLNQKLNATFSY